VGRRGKDTRDRDAEPVEQDWLETQLGKLIDNLDLQPLQRDFLRGRWLDQVRWMEGKAAVCQRRYHQLRLLVLIGGVIIPALVGLNISRANSSVQWTVFGIGLVVALSTAIESLFRFGDRWRHYRQIVELLKSEGWQFFQRSGLYASATHVESYPLFATHVEAIIQRDVDSYVTTVVAERNAQQQSGG
jgi:hypothetical protein